MNRLPGIVTAIDRCGSVALIDVAAAGHQLTATLVDASSRAQRWRIGMAVTLLFAETDVALAKQLSGRISMRNRIHATVLEMERGQILSKVVLAVAGHRLQSIITTRSCAALALEVGDSVEALVKANEMSVIADDAALPDADCIRIGA